MSGPWPLEIFLLDQRASQRGHSRQIRVGNMNVGPPVAEIQPLLPSRPSPQDVTAFLQDAVFTVFGFIVYLRGISMLHLISPQDAYGSIRYRLPTEDSSPQQRPYDRLRVYGTSSEETSLIMLILIESGCLMLKNVFLCSKIRQKITLVITSLTCSQLLTVLTVSNSMAVTNNCLEDYPVWPLLIVVWKITLACVLEHSAEAVHKYVAVTRPVSYPSLMTSTRAKILIAAVWVTSFIICFPPLVGWNDRKMNFQQSSTSSVVNSELGAMQGMNISVETDYSCHFSCELTNERGYVVYSACGSFFIPTLVMMFFYWKIYCAAAETTRAINQGFRTTKGKELLGDPYEEKRLTLRIHRGHGEQGRHYRTASQRSTNFVSNYPKSHKGKQYSLQMQNMKSNPNLKESLSLPPVLRYDPNNYKPANHCTATICAKTDCEGHHTTMELMPSPTPNCRDDTCYTVDTNLSEMETPNLPRSKKILSATSSCSSATSPLHPNCPSNSSSNLSRNMETTRLRPNNSTNRMGRRNIKVQVKRFRMETKAAKTLGIIVGVFILCWFPFFTMYLIRGFCPHCIPPLLFSIFFWLGYCNSALNPCIYALFSKDFRFAFKNILCRCIWTREKAKVLQQLPLTYNPPSLGDDRDESDES
ncbi:unnamed protein product, partial [Meganyctiphanes norvegica]